jgi:hypothetical protein
MGTAKFGDMMGCVHWSMYECYSDQVLVTAAAYIESGC